MDRFKWKMTFTEGEISTTASTFDEAVSQIQMVHDKAEMDIGEPRFVELFTGDGSVDGGTWGTVYVFPDNPEKQ